MPEQPPEPTPEFQMALAKDSHRNFDTLFDSKKREEEVKRATATGEKVLERRRREYEETSLQLDAIKNELLNRGGELQPEQLRNMLLMQICVGMPAIVQGLGILIDSVSMQEIRKLKGGKTGAARISSGRMLYDIASMVSGLYGEPDKTGKIPEGEQGVLDAMGSEMSGRLEFMIRQLFAVGGMIHMIGKHEDPRMFAGTIEDPKTGTKTTVDDLFDDKVMSQFEPEVEPVRAKEEKVFDEQEVLTEEEAEQAVQSKKVDISKAMKGLQL